MGSFVAGLLATVTADDELKVHQLIGHAVRVVLHDGLDEMLPNQMVVLLGEIEAIEQAKAVKPGETTSGINGPYSIVAQ